MSDQQGSELSREVKLLVLSILNGFCLVGFCLALLFSSKGLAVFIFLILLYLVSCLVSIWFNLGGFKDLCAYIKDYDKLENRCPELKDSEDRVE